MTPEQNKKPEYRNIILHPSVPGVCAFFWPGAEKVAFGVKASPSVLPHLFSGIKKWGERQRQRTPVHALSLLPLPLVLLTWMFQFDTLHNIVHTQYRIRGVFVFLHLVMIGLNPGQ